MLTAALVAAGESTPRGEASGVSVPLSGGGDLSWSLLGLFWSAVIDEDDESAVGVWTGVKRSPKLLNQIKTSLELWLSFLELSLS